jgi:hypothetical protein
VFLPESLPKSVRGQAGVKVGLVNLRGLWQALFGPIGGLLLPAFVGTVGTRKFESIFSLFAVDRLGYGPERVGAILTVVGVVSVIGRGLLTGAFTRRWGGLLASQDADLARAVAFALLPWARSYLAVLFTAGLFVLITSFFRPAVHSLTSQRATVGQGAAMGLSSSFVSLRRVV